MIKIVSGKDEGLCLKLLNYPLLLKIQSQLLSEKDPFLTHLFLRAVTKKQGFLPQRKLPQQYSVKATSGLAEAATNAERSIPQAILTFTFCKKMLKAQ